MQHSVMRLLKTAQSNHRSQFKQGTIISNGDWRDLNQAYSEVQSGNEFHSHHVFVGAISQGLLDILREVFNPGSREAIVQEHKNAIEDIVSQELNAQISGIPRLFVRGYYVNNPNLESLTWNQAEQCHVGLHIDSIEQGSDVPRRHRAPRLCLNLGIERRYFIFADITADEVQIGKLVDKTDLRFDEALRRYCDTNVDLNVYRVALDAGCFYVANTEYIAHDGSNEGSSLPDEQLVFLSAEALRASLEAH